MWRANCARTLWLALPCLIGQATAAESISLSAMGDLAAGDSYFSVISADGRYVAFQSRASNLVAGDTNGAQDIFLRDRLAQTTDLVSAGVAGRPATGTSAAPAISADGRFVVFESEASDLVPGDTNGVWDVFLWDREVGAVERLSRDAQGAEALGRSGGADISPNADFVVFESETALSADDSNPGMDVYRLARSDGTLALVSARADGIAGNGDSRMAKLSADGRFVVFVSTAADLVEGDDNAAADIFLKDLQTGQVTLVSRSSDGALANAASTWPAISRDARYVAFNSQASNLSPADTHNGWDLYLHDRATGQTRLATGSAGIGQLGRQSTQSQVGTYSPPSFTADGQFLFFHSPAPDLVEDDANGMSDVFRLDLRSREVARVSINEDGWAMSGHCFVPAAVSAELFTVSCENGVDEETGQPVRDIYAVGAVVEH
jgi:Tol biopolymer transport system component